MLKPTFDRILVKPITAPLSDTLIVITDPVKQSDSCQGEVIAVGPGKFVKHKRMPMDVRPGEIVRYRFHETYPTYGGYLIITEADIEGIVEA